MKEGKKEQKTMEMNIELYIEINGVKYQVDPKCCSLDFTASTSRGSETKGCLEVTASGKSVYLDIV